VQRRIWRCTGRTGPLRDHSLRAFFHGLHYIVMSGNQWQMMPHNLPPEPEVYQHMQLWLRPVASRPWSKSALAAARGAGCHAKPTALILDSPLPSNPPESGSRAAYDGAKRHKGPERRPPWIRRSSADAAKGRRRPFRSRTSPFRCVGLALADGREQDHRTRHEQLVALRHKEVFHFSGCSSNRSTQQVKRLP
jgi:hypothetical protein